MGRFEANGVVYETRGANQGVALVNAIRTFQRYNLLRKREKCAPKIEFHRQGLPYNHLRSFDMHNYILQRIAPMNRVYYIMGFSFACIAGNFVASLIYDQDVRYENLVRYPKQMKTFDNLVEAVSSRFWEFAHNYLGDLIVPNIRTPEGLYNFTYSVKNKLFKIEQRDIISKEEFEKINSQAIKSDADLQNFEDAVIKQDKELREALWKLEDVQKAQDK